jgi:8-oxo-dGTP pyrophosphatase MutT (NUDIX family)
MSLLSNTQNALLRQTLQGARRSPPPDARRWCLGEMPLGWLKPDHDAALAHELTDTVLSGGQRIWQAAHWPVAQRSQALQAAAQRLQAKGLIRGWRNELYSYWGDTGGQPHPGLPEHFRLERAAFRFLGLHSHAVHINGFTPDGRMWCGRRALSKATDPGRLDNLAAGGLPAGETVLDCALRELYEEAGLPESLARQVQPAGHITTARMEAEGWHEETLLVFNLQLPPDVQPHNTDGEVSGFECLSLDEVMQRIAACDFSEDAACVVAQGLLYGQSP